MRLKFVILLCSASALAASPTFSQDKKIDVSYQKSSLVSVLNDLKEKTGFHFVYFDGVITGNVAVTVSLKEASLENILDEVLVKNGFSYKIGDGVIAVGKAEAGRQQPPQARVITGRVTQKDTKAPLAGVNIVLSGTQTGTTTDHQGNYRLNVSGNDPVLKLSFLGLKSIEVKVGANSVVNVEMEVDDKAIDEVTVIAYGTRDKKTLISSVSSVKAADIDDLPAASLETLLQGQMAGVEVNNVSGAPGGGGSAVRVRGYNSLMDGSAGSEGLANVRDGSPLYVIDGVPVNAFTSAMTGTNMLAEIDPSTIASVEVLKDAASAALYGSRASNGVILITTKQGLSGEAKFTANASYSHSFLPQTPTQVIGHGERLFRLQSYRNMTVGYHNSWLGTTSIPTSYLDSYNNRDVEYDYFWNKGLVNRQFNNIAPLTDSLNAFYNNASNFWKTTFQAGQILNANVSASGGTENLRYMVGAGVYDEEGIMVASNFTRYNILTNLNATPVKNFKLDTRLYIAYTERLSGSVKTRGTSGLASVSRIEALTASPSSYSSLYPSTGVVADQIVKDINEKSSKSNSLRLRANVTGMYNILPELAVRSTMAIDYNQSHLNAFEPASYNSISGSKSSGAWKGQNVFINENLITYSKSFGDRHNLEFIAGTSYTRESENSMQGYGMGGPNDYIHYVDDSWPLTYLNGSTRESAKQFLSDFVETKMMSYLARAAYNFDKKYLMEITFRRDGSSTFAEDRRWADFPSVAVGWNFSDEKFMNNFWWLNLGKLRASWGKTGQTFADPYLAHGTWTSGNRFLDYVGVMPSTPLNTVLTWEKSDQYNVGLDLDMLNNRVRIKADYYYKYSSSVLNSVQMPGNFNYFDASFQNVMEISNEGLEIEASVDIINKSDLKWRAKLNISRNWNQLVKSDTGQDLVRNNSLLVIGRPIYGLYVMKDLGIVQKDEDIPIYWTATGAPQRLRADNVPYIAGMRLYEDMNSDGKISTDDMYYAASTLPAVHGGIASELMWRNFDVNVLFTYSLGRHLINNYVYSSAGFMTGLLRPLFMDPSEYTFWTPGSGNTDYPTMGVANTTFYTAQFSAASISSRIEKVNFIRLKQITLGYTLPKTVAKKIGLTGLRVFATAENLFLLTNYSGIDPEIVSPQMGYDNFSNYPLACKITMGLTVNF